MANPYRTKTFRSEDGELIELRDDGFRIHFRIVETTAINVDTSEVFLWADYKQCELVGPAIAIANLLMQGSECPAVHS